MGDRIRVLHGPGRLMQKHRLDAGHVVRAGDGSPAAHKSFGGDSIQGVHPHHKFVVLERMTPQLSVDVCIDSLMVRELPTAKEFRGEYRCQLYLGITQTRRWPDGLSGLNVFAS